MKPFSEITAFVEGQCPHGVTVLEGMTPAGLLIDSRDLKQLCYVLRDNPGMHFDMLSCITALDNGVDAGTFDVVYNLYSIPFGHHLSIKVVVPRQLPEIASVQDVWKTANWHEREAWDLFGITFTGHPDLRRILLPADWEGHPLRKDYEHQKYYRGIKVD